MYDKCVERPEMAHTYFSHRGVIDFHNQQRQGILQLEKKWLTQDPYFRLATSIIGIHVVDADCLYKYTLKSKVQKITLLEFTKILASQSLHKNTENLNLHELIQINYL